MLAPRRAPEVVSRTVTFAVLERRVRSLLEHRAGDHRGPDDRLAVRGVAGAAVAAPGAAGVGHREDGTHEGGEAHRHGQHRHPHALERRPALHHAHAPEPAQSCGSGAYDTTRRIAGWSPEPSRTRRLRSPRVGRRRPLRSHDGGSGTGKRRPTAPVVGPDPVPRGRGHPRRGRRVFVAIAGSALVFPYLSQNSDEGAYLTQASALRGGNLVPDAPQSLPQLFQPWFSVLRDGHFVFKYAPVHPASLAVVPQALGGTRTALGLIAAATVLLVVVLARGAGCRPPGSADRRCALRPVARRHRAVGDVPALPGQPRLPPRVRRRGSPGRAHRLRRARRRWRPRSASRSGPVPTTHSSSAHR